jgi:hypothetical protein
MCIALNLHVMAMFIIFFIKTHFYTEKHLLSSLCTKLNTHSCTVSLVSAMFLLYIPQKYYVNQRCVFIQHSLFYLISVA